MNQDVANYIASRGLAGTLRKYLTNEQFKEQPKRPWRPMTEEEKDGLLLPFGSYGEMEAIEALLKEKNGV